MDMTPMKESIKQQTALLYRTQQQATTVVLYCGIVLSSKHCCMLLNINIMLNFSIAAVRAHDMCILYSMYHSYGTFYFDPHG